MSDCAISAAGIVDADALSSSEKPSPVAPSTVTAAALVVLFCFEACLTRGMVCILRKFCLRWKVCARQIRRARVACALRCEPSHRVPIHLHERNRQIAAFVERNPVSHSGGSTPGVYGVSGVSASSMYPAICVQGRAAPSKRQYGKRGSQLRRPLFICRCDAMSPLGTFRT